ncbi:MAG: methylated-DNA--[protein]-cysteine S-methyltransferase [Chloroflexota bacterium]
MRSGSGDRTPEPAAGAAGACAAARAAMPAAILGDLDAAETARLAAHAASCGPCGEELAAHRRLGAALDAACDPGEVAVPAVRLPGPGPAAWQARVESPIGPIVLAASGEGLCALSFGGFRGEGEIRRMLTDRGFSPRQAGPETPPAAAATLQVTETQLAEYFAGTRSRFDLPLDLRGVTPFTRAVLTATAEVPFGRLETYRGIAGRIGKPGASRAVGNALGRNPVPVVLPCHRVIATGGGIGGYTGGLGIKQRLLAIEGTALA